MKQTTAMFTFVKKKESEDMKGEVYTFVGENTLPDRTRETLPDGTEIEGEILSKLVLDKDAACINDESKLGGKYGSYRTVSLFHDRVQTGDYSLEEAGFAIPGSAVVQEMESSPGNYELLVDVEVNKHYVSVTYPDHTPEKINYKIQKGAIGLSKEYNNRPDQERIVEVNGKNYRYIMDSDDFRGFGFARANLIGNPSAVRVKEILIAKKINKIGEDKMEEDIKLKEAETQLETATAKIKELEEEKKVAEEAKDDKKVEDVDKKVEEAKEKVADVEEKVKELKLANDSTAAKIKETLELGFSSMKFDKPAKTKEDVKVAKVKEVYSSITGNEVNFVKFKETTEQHIEAQEGYLAKFKEMIASTGSGFDFEQHQTLKVKCIGGGDGRMMVIPSAKTKDVLDSTDMSQTDYYETNAMFADRYVAGITETFLKEDSLLTAIPKENYMGGNDRYQWRMWVDFTTVTGAKTLSVNPDVTSVTRTQRDFSKNGTPIREYRDGVEVTDFTQHHSMAAVGDLLGQQLERAAEAVTESMNSDLFKPKSDDTAGWLGFTGLLAVADSATYTSMYGKTRSAANRLLDATTANTYLSTAEAISVDIMRDGYEKVLEHGSSLGSIAIAIHPTQMRRLWNTEDSAIRNQILTMSGAPPTFGFNRAVIPHLDGIPMIRDYRCESSAAAKDMYCVIDFSTNKGFNLIVSKPLGARGLAKVGTSEAAYVSFWGCTVYKSPRNVFVHDSLTTS